MLFPKKSLDGGTDGSVCSEYASDEVSAVWLLKCHLVEVDEPCYHMKYQDSVYGMNLAALTRFIKYQDDKHMVGNLHDKRQGPDSI